MIHVCVVVLTIWTFLTIAIGACLGSWLRFLFGYFLNPLFPIVPPGTLCANILGSLLIGGVVAITREHALSPRLLIGFTTGFLGSLSTFSTFAAEALHLYQEHDIFWMVVLIVLHVVGSLLAAALGFLLLKSIFI